MVNALRELGVEILAAGTQNSTLEDFHRMKALMHADARIIDDTSTAGLIGVMREKQPDLIVAGGKTKFLALKTRTPFLDINHGRSHPYAGFEGMVDVREAARSHRQQPHLARARREGAVGARGRGARGRARRGGPSRGGAPRRGSRRPRA